MVLGHRRHVRVGNGSTAPLTTQLMSTGDTYVRGGSPNQNLGTSTTLWLQEGGPKRTLVRFDAAQVAALPPGASVSLTMTIASTGDNWGTTGRPIALYRLTHDWTELGATWNARST